MGESEANRPDIALRQTGGIAAVNLRRITGENSDAILHADRPEGAHSAAPDRVAPAQARPVGKTGMCFRSRSMRRIPRSGSCRRIWTWPGSRQIVISPEHEGRGYASAAVRLLIRLARESGRYRALYLDCAPDNAAARHTCEKPGFRPTGDINHGSVEMRLTL